ncbi:hypothetical protein CBL_10030 [Carabus blaptoides fortunei]
MVRPLLGTWTSHGVLFTSNCVLGSAAGCHSIGQPFPTKLVVQQLNRSLREATLTPSLTQPTSHCFSQGKSGLAVSSTTVYECVQVYHICLYDETDVRDSMRATASSEDWYKLKIELNWERYSKKPSQCSIGKSAPMIFEVLWREHKTLLRLQQQNQPRSENTYKFTVVNVPLLAAARDARRYRVKPDIQCEVSGANN